MIERTEQEIMRNWKGDVGTPLVSICTITYNHEKFITEALDSFLMQETDFPFEIVIDDDFSPDGTAEMIRKYMEKFPNIINANVRKENVGMMINFTENMQRAKGKYIALCEGDDYWIDPLKLQKQVDFLERKEEYVATYHDVLIIDEFNKERDDWKDSSLKINKSYTHTLEDSENKISIGQTASLLYRNIWPTLPEKILSEFNKCESNGDIKLSALLLLTGKIFCYEQTMSVYRLITSSGDSWNASHANKDMNVEICQMLISIDHFAQKAFDKSLPYKKHRINISTSGALKAIKKPTIKNLTKMVHLLVLNRKYFLNIIVSTIKAISKKIKVSKI